VRYDVAASSHCADTCSIGLDMNTHRRKHNVYLLKLTKVVTATFNTRVSVACSTLLPTQFSILIADEILQRVCDLEFVKFMSQGVITAFNESVITEAFKVTIT